MDYGLFPNFWDSLACCKNHKMYPADDKSSAICKKMHGKKGQTHWEQGMDSRSGLAI